MDEWRVAAELARMPEVWARLVKEHTADHAGRCAGCRTQRAPGPRWPCRLYSLAAEARRIGGDRDP